MMRLLSIFVGQPREVTYKGRTVETGIFKEIVEGPVRVGQLNLEGDRQADLSVHGGVDKAVYAYPSEHYAYWKKARPDLQFRPGVFGENLALSGLDESEVSIGDTFSIGSAEFQVTIPRMPCFKLGIKMGDPGFVREFLIAGRNGFYFRVLKEGVLEAGDPVEKTGEDGYGLRVSEVVSLYSSARKDRELLEKAVGSPSLAGDWVAYFKQQIQRHAQQEG